LKSDTRKLLFISGVFRVVDVDVELDAQRYYRFTIRFGTLSASNPPSTMNAASIYMPLAFDAVTCFNHPTR
jgi:hypothetical protein